MTLRTLMTFALVSQAGCAGGPVTSEASPTPTATPPEVLHELNQGARLICQGPGEAALHREPVWLLWTDFEGPLSVERARALSAAGYRTSGNAALTAGERSYQLVLTPAQARWLAREEPSLSFRCDELGQPNNP